MKRELVTRALAIVALLLVLLGALDTEALLAQSPEPLVTEEIENPTPTEIAPTGDAATPVPTRLLQGMSSSETAQPEPAAEGTPAAPVEGEEPEPTPTRVFEGVIDTRTPEPTATPGLLSEQAELIASAAGLESTTFLGLAAADWINLGFSVILVLVSYLLGTLLIRRILPPAVRRSPTQFDDRVLEEAGPDIRWLVVIAILHFATVRLVFVSAVVKDTLTDIYFVAGLFIAALIVFKLVNLADQWYRERAAHAGREEQLDPVITLLVRVGRVVAGLTALIILLSHFGVNVTAFAAALGLGGLAFSLAARDTIADAIAGFIILVDRPFRIGDRIEIQEVGTWGDVVDIGLRTTRIRTRDNRMVIVPNSVIGANQVINYSYPDPRYRIETHVGVAYGTDIETARQIMIDAVRLVEGVLPDRPVDALYIEMGDSAMIFRVRWWIESYIDTRRMLDRVHTTLQHALDGAGIESPYPTQTLNLEFGPEGADHLTQRTPRGRPRRSPEGP
jgi:small-conductance mechanosensitive channel